jgi:hypothetical protein
MASISKQSKETQDRHRKMLIELLKRPENHECMDCRARNPTWASINLGVFVCIRCSGLHRQVGVHITQVRSCTMDLWEPSQIAFMQSMGNAKGRAVFEALLPADYGKPAESEDSQLVLQWIRTKYEKKRYYNAAGAVATTSSTTATNPKSMAATTTAPPMGSDGSDILTLAKARPRKPKSAKPTEDASSPSSPPPDSPINFTFDQFMSPAVQSPRGECPTFDGASAFGFIQSNSQDGAPAQDATASPRDATRDSMGDAASASSPLRAPAAGQPSGFAFLSQGAVVETDEVPGSTTSVFSFIASPAAAASPSLETPQSCGPSVPSLMDFGESGAIRPPPPIPGHFASPVIEEQVRGYVFDPFHPQQHHHDPPTSMAPTAAPPAAPNPPVAPLAAPGPPLALVEPLPPVAVAISDPQSLLLAMQRQMEILQQQLAAAAVPASPQ